MSTYDPDALECLAAIVEEGGFERAAVRLAITQSAVSQRLARRRRRLKGRSRIFNILAPLKVMSESALSSDPPAVLLLDIFSHIKNSR